MSGSPSFSKSMAHAAHPQPPSTTPAWVGGVDEGAAVVAIGGCARCSTVPAMSAVADALAAAGLRHRYPDIADELLARGAVLPLLHGSGMEVDLVLAGSGLEALALERATRVAIDGVEVPVAYATDLVVMKVLAGRGKDRRQGAALTIRTVYG